MPPNVFCPSARGKRPSSISLPEATQKNRLPSDPTSVLESKVSELFIQINTGSV